MIKGILLFIIFSLASVLVLSADIPKLISYQGMLITSGGSPVTDGNHAVVFTIYDSPVGGKIVWTSGSQTVQTTNGNFTYLLGSNVTLDYGNFTSNERYLGVKVGNDPELSPRSQLASVPYTYHAQRAEISNFTSNGPGIASNFYPGLINVTSSSSSPQVIDSISIDVPDSGFIVIQVQGNFSMKGTDGITTWIQATIDDVPNSHNFDHGAFWRLAQSHVPGDRDKDFSILRVVPVSAGTYKFYLNASRGYVGAASTFQIHNPNILAIYYPVSYGEVISD